MSSGRPGHPLIRCAVCAGWLACAVAVMGPAQPAAERVPLAETSQAQTPEGRERLQYLISCALPEGIVVETQVAGVRYEFPGHLGIAPAWRLRALTPDESRWVSACILARTNYFGRTVQISMRADQATVAALNTDADERERFSLHEAGFFGNIFSDESPAYACLGDQAADREQQLRSLYRVCTLPDEPASAGHADTRPLSRCGFIIVGPCSARPFVQDGTDYSGQVVHVYLAP